MDHPNRITTAPADPALAYKALANHARSALMAYDSARLAYALALIETEARHGELVAALARVDTAEAALAKSAPPGVLNRSLPAPAPFDPTAPRTAAVWVEVGNLKPAPVRAAVPAFPE